MGNLFGLGKLEPLNNQSYIEKLDKVQNSILNVLKTDVYKNELDHWLNHEGVNLNGDLESLITNLQLYIKSGDPLNFQKNKLSYMENEKGATQTIIKRKYESLSSKDIFGAKQVNQIVSDSIDLSKKDLLPPQKIKKIVRESIMKALHSSLAELELVQTPEWLQRMAHIEKIGKKEKVNALLGKNLKKRVELAKFIPFEPLVFGEWLNSLNSLRIANLHPSTSLSMNQHEQRLIDTCMKVVARMSEEGDLLQNQRIAITLNNVLLDLLKQEDIYIYFSKFDNTEAIITTLRYMIKTGSADLSVLTCPDYSGESKIDGTYQYNFLWLNDGLGTVTKKSFGFVKALSTSLEKYGINVTVNHFLPSFECKGDGFSSDVCSISKDEFINLLKISGEKIGKEYKKMNIFANIGVSNEIVNDEEMETQKDILYEHYLNRLKSDKKFKNNVTQIFNNRKALYLKRYPQKKAQRPEERVKEERLYIQNMLEEYWYANEGSNEGSKELFMDSLGYHLKDFYDKVEQNGGELEEEYNNRINDIIIDKHIKQLDGFIQKHKVTYDTIYGQGAWDKVENNCLIDWTSDKLSDDRKKTFVEKRLISTKNTAEKVSLKEKRPKNIDETDHNYMRRLGETKWEEFKQKFIQYKVDVIPSEYWSFLSNKDSSEWKSYCQKFLLEYPEQQRKRIMKKNKKKEQESDIDYSLKVMNLRETTFDKDFQGGKFTQLIKEAGYDGLIKRKTFIKKLGIESSEEYEKRISYIAYHHLLRKYNTDEGTKKEIDAELLEVFQNNKKLVRENDVMFKMRMKDDFIADNTTRYIDVDEIKSLFPINMQQLKVEDSAQYERRLVQQFLRQLAEYEVMANSFSKKDNQMMIAADSRPMYDIVYGLNNHAVIYGQGKDSQDYEGA